MLIPKWQGLQCPNSMADPLAADTLSAFILLDRPMTHNDVLLPTMLTVHHPATHRNGDQTHLNVPTIPNGGGYPTISVVRTFRETSHIPMSARCTFGECLTRPRETNYTLCSAQWVPFGQSGGYRDRMWRSLSLKKKRVSPQRCSQRIDTNSSCTVRRCWFKMPDRRSNSAVIWPPKNNRFNLQNR